MLTTTGVVLMTRTAQREYIFSDGTYVPAGTIIGVPSTPHHLDAVNYEEPDGFDPARFEHTKDGEATRKYFTSIDPDYLAFGLG
jgi:cytochrome P450